MKKIASILLLVLTFAIDVHAELEEVRGILTKQEERDGVFCFIFINENDYPVWLDMEVYHDATNYYDTSQRYTKSITLQAGETYEWKPEVYRPQYSGLNVNDFHTKYKAYKKQ